MVLSAVLVAACSSEPSEGIEASADSPAASEITRQATSTASAPTSSETKVDAETSITAPATTALEATTSVDANEEPVAPAVSPPPCLASLDNRDKAALLVWPSVYSNDWATAVSVVNEHGVGGVILMRPRLSADTLRSRIDQLDDASDLGVLVATDEEGGDVQRLVDIEPLASQAELSASLSPGDAYTTIATHAAVVAGLGVDIVLGPVVDLLPADGRRPPLQTSRFFQGDSTAVTDYAQAYVDGWKSAGLLPVLKHFPGHGSASGDTHTAAGVTPPIEVLTESDLIPYRRLVETGAGVMLGHLTVPGLTDGLPASTSAPAISYLRDELGYQDALVMTDALDMTAAGGPIPETAVAALVAGADVLLFTSIGETGAVIDAIVSALDTGQLSPERLSDAAGRVLALLEDRGHGCSAE